MKLHEIYSPETLVKMRDEIPHGGMKEIEANVGVSYSYVNDILGGKNNLTITASVKRVMEEVTRLIRCSREENEALKKLSKEI